MPRNPLFRFGAFATVATEPQVAAPPSPSPIRVAQAEAKPVATSHPNDSRDVVKYGLLLLQLVALVAVFRTFRVVDSTFVQMSGLTVGAFAVHYWLPFRWKKPFFVLFSMLGAFALLDPVVAAMILGSGLALYALLNMPVRYAVRAGLLAAVAVTAMAFRNVLPESDAAASVINAFWPVFGGIFMFRMMIYAYDLRHENTRGTFLDYLAYFFLLPNYVFLLFPVIDYQTMRSTYYNSEFHKQAQQGVRWIARGAVQLLIYRLIYHLRPNPAPDDVTNLTTLIVAMVTTYLLYLRLSGAYHIIIGMLHLFGFNLPETHRNYLLSSSITDFWRRINIYWKDFMVKMFYYPIFFRLRRFGTTWATVWATTIVFSLTWLLHSYQFYWLSGEFLLVWHDALFWAILACIVFFNVLYEMRPKPSGRQATTNLDHHVMKVAGMLCVIIVLWSMWNATSLSEWIDMVTYWEIG